MTIKRNVSFQNQTIVITGASQGLGAELAKKFATEQANLVLFARNRQKLEDLAEELRRKAHSVLVVAGDITSERDSENLLQETERNFGKIDILVNNAGASMWSKFSDAQNMQLVRDLMEINFFGAIRCTQNFLPFLRERKGLIVNILSLQSLLSAPFHSSYSASKKALKGFFDSLKLEEPSIDILNVYPYWISGTSINQNRLDGQSPKARNKKGMCVRECAEKIFKATEKRKEELYLPSYIKFIPLMETFFPKLLRTIVLKKTKEASKNL